MDDRQLPQQQVQVGAGLQESRLNTELIEWLEKWGTWILTGLLIVVLVYVGWGRLKQWQLAKHDRAFAAYVAARGTPGPDDVLTGSPESLLRVVQEHGNAGSIRDLAKLDAAEIYLGAARRGIAPGGNLLAPAEGDILGEQQTRDMFTTSLGLFEEVVAQTRGNADKQLIQARALFGVAAAAASIEQWEKAQSVYDQVIDLAASAGLPDLAARAERHKRSLDLWREPIALYPESELPESMRPVVRQPANPFGQMTMPVRMGADGQLEVIPEGEMVPQGTPIEGQPEPSPALPSDGG